MTKNGDVGLLNMFTLNGCGGEYGIEKTTLCDYFIHTSAIAIERNIIM